MALTVDFVAAVRRQGSITAQFSDADIMATGDIEVQTRFLPLLRRMRSEYGVRRLLLPIANGRVVMPDRSQVAGVRLVQLVQSNSYVTLPQVMPEQDYGPGVGGVPYGWYFDAAGINVVPSNSSGSVLVRYYQAAPSMILSSLSTLSSPLTIVTEGPTTTTIGYTVGTYTNGDIISARPSHHVILPGVVTGVSGVVFNNSIYATQDSDRPVVGDWVTQPGRTPFVPLPEELFGALVHRTAGVMLRASGYLEESGAQLQVSDEAEVLARDLLAPRSEGSPRVLLGGLKSVSGRRAWRW